MESSLQRRCSTKETCGCPPTAGLCAAVRLTAHISFHVYIRLFPASLRADRDRCARSDSNQRRHVPSPPLVFTSAPASPSSAGLVLQEVSLNTSQVSSLRLPGAVPAGSAKLPHYSASLMQGLVIMTRSGSTLRIQIWSLWWIL